MFYFLWQIFKRHFLLRKANMVTVVNVTFWRQFIPSTGRCQDITWRRWCWRKNKSWFFRVQIQISVRACFPILFIVMGENALKTYIQTKLKWWLLVEQKSLKLHHSKSFIFWDHFHRKLHLFWQNFGDMRTSKCQDHLSKPSFFDKENNPLSNFKEQ